MSMTVPSWNTVLEYTAIRLISVTVYSMLGNPIFWFTISIKDCFKDERADEVLNSAVLHNRQANGHDNVLTLSDFSPSVCSEIPKPVSPLSAVLGCHPKRLWNFSDTAGVSHSVSECPTGAQWTHDVTLYYGYDVHNMRLAVDCTGFIPASLGFWYFCEVVIPVAVTCRQHSLMNEFQTKKNNSHNRDWQKKSKKEETLSLQTSWSKSFHCSAKLQRTKRSGRKAATKITANNTYKLQNNNTKWLISLVWYNKMLSCFCITIYYTIF